MATTGPTTLGICSGIGMLEEAVRLVFPGSRCAALCEWEAYAAATLLARMEDAALECAPVWCGDLRDFDAAPFRGLVDIITAGLPCQPYSVAGRKQGNTDARSWGEYGDGPIPGFLRIVEACRPALVFLENVPTWVRAGWFRLVGEELCRLGYEIVEPVFLAAEDVGASHKRERVFILAYAKNRTGGICGRWQGWKEFGCGRENVAQSQERGQRELRESSGRDGQFDGSDCALADAASVRFQGRRGEHPGERLSGSDSGELADAFATGSHVALSSGRHRAAGLASETGGEIFAPSPSARDWGQILDQSPHLAPAVEPGLRVLADGLAVVVDEARADQLRCVGNGVVALCAAVALVEALRRINTP